MVQMHVQVLGQFLASLKITKSGTHTKDPDPPVYPLSMNYSIPHFYCHRPGYCLLFYTYLVCVYDWEWGFQLPGEQLLMVSM